MNEQGAPNVDVDVAIVGGGLAGLIAANLAADAGATVALFDGRPLGGRARTESQDGYMLNHGPHALYRGEALDTALQAFGIKAEGSKPKLRNSLGTLAGATGTVPTGVTTLVGSKLIDGRGKRQFAKFLPRLMRAKPAELGSISVDDWIADQISQPEARELIRGLAMLSTYSCDSDVASADAAVTNMKAGFVKGVLYLDRGWQQIVDRLSARIVGRVDLVDAHVSDINHPAGGGIEVVDEAGVKRRARSVIVAPGTPATADALLGRSDLADAAGPPVRAAALDLGVRTMPTVDFALSMVDNTYLSVHSVADGLAPKDQHLVLAARYLRRDDALSPGDSRALLERAAVAAGIDLNAVAFDRYLHKMVVTWGVPLAAQGGFAGRPSVDQGNGVFLAGDWVGTEGLLADASAASASAAVRGAMVIGAGQR